ncbi:MAG: hypothetical protein H6Q38_1037 [Chloroflexi bacterium]|nr:hypothetical protein [Chloroflexota bacterium]
MKSEISTITQHGYLVIADISGYTSFVAQTELEHSQEILAELLELLMEKFQPLMTISKLEGDAIFAYAHEAMFPRGETLIELIESIYVAFRDKQVSMKLATTCKCNACRNIPTLDLKFFAHCGDYFVQQVMNTRELVGSDVNLIHRLTKNHVSETTGWRAYIMLTEQCLNHLQLNLEDAYIQMETYEHLGEIKTYNIDLHKRYQEITDERHIMIDEKDADFVLEVDFSTPPPVTWDWLQDPAKINQWGDGRTRWFNGDRPKGRTGKGASNHCAHSKGVSTKVTLDWRPFEYSTHDSFKNGKKVFAETIRLEPLPDGGTRLHDVIQVPSLHILPQMLRRTVAQFIMKMLKYDQFMKKAMQMAGEEFAKTKSE